MKLAPPLPPIRVIAAVAAAVVSGSLLMSPDVAHASPSPQLAQAEAPSAAVPTVAAATGGLGRSSVLLANFPLAQVGYTQSEFVFSGTARSYTNTAPLTSDGNWSAQPADSAAYTSRMVVVRPQDPAKFSGTVVVEWMNVSGGQDGTPNWSFGHDDLIRNGDVYVGVSAQAVGINAAKAVDPARYAALSHPGDSFSYDIFSQAGQAVRSLAPTVLGGLEPEVVVAEGESQSAFRLTTYTNAIAELVDVYDSYLINSRSGTSAPLSQSPQADIPAPAVVLQSDIGLPVLVYQTETDVAGPLNYLPARQGDSENFRLWEAAGTSHADTYLLNHSFDDNGTWGSDLRQFASLSAPPSSISVSGFSLTCTVPFNAGQQHYTFQTAQRNLIDWTWTGDAPRSMPRLSVDTTTTPASYRKDANGNVLGGVRSPAVDAPIATLSGTPPVGAPGFCLLFGQTDPFTPTELSALYPRADDFAQAWRRAVDSNLAAGYLLPADATRLRDLVTYLNGTESLVTRIYLDLFGRTPDEAGLRQWTNEILAGKPVSAVANGITGSAEFRTGLIRSDYQHYLDRTPSAAEVAFWLGQLNQGWTPERLEVSFAASQEFYNAAGGTDADWVQALYGAVLGREGSADEVAAHVRTLQAGTGRLQVARAFVVSAEHLGAVLDGYYRLLLDRPIDPAGRTSWTAFLQGGGRIERVVAAIVSSPESVGRFVTPVPTVI